MAFRTWAAVLGTTAGAAVLAGASQLGLAYGLGILRLTRVVDVTARDEWIAQLVWVAWIAMTAAAIGGIVGRARLPRQAGAPTRITVAVAAGLGSAVVVPLTMQPARTAQVAGVDPVLVIGICAALAVPAGIVAAYAALSRVVARWSLITVGIAVWVIAIVSVAPSLSPGDPLPAVRVGVLDAAFLEPSVTRRTALITMPVLALVCGAILGWAARRRKMSTVDITLAGLPGPALLTAAYLIAGPGSGSDRYQMIAYWAAMTAAGAGVLGSVLAAVLRRGPVGAGRPSSGRGPAGTPEEATPTPDRPPLPRRDAQPDSAIANAGTTTAQRPDPESRPSGNDIFPVRTGPPFDGFTPSPTRAAGQTNTSGPPDTAAPAHGSAAVPPRNVAVPPGRAAIRPDPAPAGPAEPHRQVSNRRT